MAQPPVKAPRELPQQVIEDMVRQQAQQLEIRNREIALQEKQLDHQTKYAERVLAAQAEDLKDQRVHEGKQTNRKLIGGGVAVVLVLGFLITCILTGHETIALEMVKAVLYTAFAGGGGYAIGKGRGKKGQDTAE